MKKDLTAGSPLKVLLIFAWPLLIANLFQQLYNLADSVIVGKFVGSYALGAVGLSFSVFFLLVSVCQGLGIGCSIVISQFFGAKKYQEVVNSIWTCLIMFVGLGILFSGLGQLIIRPMLSLLNCPIEIYAYAVTYLTFIFAGCTFTFLYNAVSAIFIALGDSKTSTVFLIFAAILNVGLDLYFVIGLKMEVAGVALATLIAQGSAALLSGSVLIYRLKDMGCKDIKYFDLELLRKMLKIAIPSVIQQSIVSLSILTVQGLVNSYGSDMVAAFTAASKLDNMAMLPMFSLSNAMSTFTAQNIGANKIKRIKEGYIGAMLFSVLICICISFVVFLFGRQMIGWFVNQDTAARVFQLGYEYMRVVSVCYILMAILFITNGVLRGSGDMLAFMSSSFTNLGSRIVFAYALTAIIGYQGIFYAIPIGWGLGGIISVIRYRTGGWQSKAVVQTTVKEL